HYRPAEHQLVRRGAFDADAQRFVRSLARSTIARGKAWVAMAVTARIGRLSWKYEGLAYALALKELGGLMQTVCLCAHAFGLGACIAGNGGLDPLAASAGIDRLEEPQIGELIIGKPAA